MIFPDQKITNFFTSYLHNIWDNAQLSTPQHKKHMDGLKMSVKLLVLRDFSIS